jgi:hypothetical protein
MKWPRGRYNGERIVGLSVKVRVDVTRWHLWMPTRYAWCLWVGPVGMYFGWEYRP